MSQSVSRLARAWRFRVSIAVALLLAATSPVTGSRVLAGQLPIVVNPVAPKVRYGVIGAATVVRSVDRGATWQTVIKGSDPLEKGSNEHRFVSVAILSMNTLWPSRVYLQTVGNYGYYMNEGTDTYKGGFWVSDDAGTHWTARNDGLPYDQDPTGRTDTAYTVSGVVQDPARPRVFYAYVKAGAEPYSKPPPLTGLYRTDDEGLHWQWASRGLRLTPLGRCCPHVLQVLPGHLEISNLDTRILLFSNPTGLYLSHSSGRIWSRVTLPGSSRPVGGFDPCDGAVLYAATNRGVWQSVNAGSTWQAVPLKRPLDFVPASVVFDIDCGGGACYGCSVEIHGGPGSGHVRHVAPPNGSIPAGAVAVAVEANPFGPPQQIVLAVRDLSIGHLTVSLTSGGFRRTLDYDSVDAGPGPFMGLQDYAALHFPSGQVHAPATLTVIVGKNKLSGTLHFRVGQDAVLTMQGHL